CACECAVATAQKHTHNSTWRPETATALNSTITHYQVRDAILIYIRNKNRASKLPSGGIGNCRLQFSISVAQQNSDWPRSCAPSNIAVSAKVSHGHVKVVISIQVSDGQRVGKVAASGVANRVLECSIPVSKQDAYRSLRWIYAVAGA